MTLLTFGQGPLKSTPASSEVDPDEELDGRPIGQQISEGFKDFEQQFNADLGEFRNAIAGLPGGLDKAVGGFVDAATARLAAAGLKPGGESTTTPSASVGARFKGGQDLRARLTLSPKSGPILYRDPQNRLLRPLLGTNGIVWPYTPTINTAYAANYAPMNPTHSNYAQLSYNFSNVENITCVGTFTANTPSEAAYLLAVINFMRSAVKMFFGEDQLRGTPPPVLRFSAHGPDVYNSVPVVLTSFSQDYEPGVDYIDAYANGRKSRVPTQMTINATMMPVVARIQQRNWSLVRYARGELNGDPNGIGGTP